MRGREVLREIHSLEVREQSKGKQGLGGEWKQKQRRQNLARIGKEERTKNEKRKRDLDSGQMRRQANEKGFGVYTLNPTLIDKGQSQRLAIWAFNIMSSFLCTPSVLALNMLGLSYELVVPPLTIVETFLKNRCFESLHP
ncbi:hypothetical protein VNO77_20303 [Canavalia gladiata]|uniref:Uncharacterized protein n=1 Tax=Canavalia gladiata TaxID=3824 RepID=A0AAN9LNZ1_CANGL